MFCIARVPGLLQLQIFWGGVGWGGVGWGGVGWVGVGWFLELLPIGPEENDSYESWTSPSLSSERDLNRTSALRSKAKTNGIGDLEYGVCLPTCVSQMFHPREIPRDLPPLQARRFQVILQRSLTRRVPHGESRDPKAWPSWQNQKAS